MLHAVHDLLCMLPSRADSCQTIRACLHSASLRNAAVAVQALAVCVLALVHLSGWLLHLRRTELQRL